jgi:predicted DNA-binding ribbon-helix-helix protein
MSVARLWWDQGDEVLFFRQITTPEKGTTMSRELPIRPLRSRDNRQVRVDGRPTTLTVELPIWERFKLIAFHHGISMSKLLSEIERTMRLEPRWPGHSRVRSLSSAVRIFVTENSQLVILPRKDSTKNVAPRARAQSPRSARYGRR